MARPNVGLVSPKAKAAGWQTLIVSTSLAIITQVQTHPLALAGLPPVWTAIIIAVLPSAAAVLGAYAQPDPLRVGAASVDERPASPAVNEYAIAKDTLPTKGLVEVPGIPPPAVVVTPSAVPSVPLATVAQHVDPEQLADVVATLPTESPDPVFH